MFWQQVSVQGKAMGCVGVFLPFPTGGQAPDLVHCDNAECLLLSPKIAFHQHTKNTCNSNI